LWKIGSTFSSNSIATTVCATLSATVGTPSVRTPPPALGISTARTGGGKYEPDDIRFQILYKFPCRSVSNAASDCPSTPGAPLLASTLQYAFQTFHFEMSYGLLVDPDSPMQLLPDYPVGCMRSLNGPAPSLRSHYRSLTTTTSRSASTRDLGTQRLTVSAAQRTPSRRDRGSIHACLLTFRANAAEQVHVASMPDTTWPVTRVPARLIPEPKRRPGFDATYIE
jgi:hypothetical protein